MKQQMQALLGWFELQDAIAALLGFQLPAPNQDTSAQKATYEAMRRAIQARPPFEAKPAAIVELHTLQPQEQAELLKALIGPAAVAEGRFSLAVIDLRALISAQKSIHLDALARHKQQLQADDWDSLMEFCLPRRRNSSPFSGSYDKDGRGITVSSNNPNLRVGSLTVSEGTAGPGSVVFSFPFHFGSNFVHVAEYRQRFFLKDGYHRCHTLLRNGIHRAPVVLQRARNFRDVISDETGGIAHEHLVGPHPPMVTDFLDPAFSATISRRSQRKVFRIRADEFFVDTADPEHSSE